MLPLWHLHNMHQNISSLTKQLQFVFISLYVQLNYRCVYIYVSMSLWYIVSRLHTCCVVFVCVHTNIYLLQQFEMYWQEYICSYIWVKRIDARCQSKKKCRFANVLSLFSLSCNRWTNRFESECSKLASYLLFRYNLEY